MSVCHDQRIWICREPEEGRKNVLLCIDGSEAVSRMTDHVGYVLGSGLEHKVTLFHVDHGQRLDTQKVFENARQRLLENSVKAENIRTKTVKAMRVSKAIIDEAEKNRYAVIAMGLVGRRNEGLKDWFIGSKSQKIIQRAQKAVFWGCF